MTRGDTFFFGIMATLICGVIVFAIYSAGWMSGYSEMRRNVTYCIEHSNDVKKCFGRLDILMMVPIK